MDPTVLAISIVILLFSVILHEVMHGWVALKFGDRTAENAGRLTLNPIPHIDPIGTILLPLILVISGSGFIFGWAKPVPVNPLNFSNIRKGELLTSAAGILANFGLAVTSALLFHLTLGLNNTFLSAVLSFAISINLLLAVFNLLPIPPLDGSKILMSYLPLKYLPYFQSLERYGIFILLLLWLIPFGNTTLLWSILGFFLNIFSSLLGL